MLLSGGAQEPNEETLQRKTERAMRNVTSFFHPELRNMSLDGRNLLNKIFIIS